MRALVGVPALSSPLMSFTELFDDPRQLGLSVLILVAALYIGVAISRLVPRDKGPTLFGTLAALAFLGGLSYLGVEAAAYVLWLFLAGAVLLGLFALVTG
jgi:hypothetical protein